MNSQYIYRAFVFANLADQAEIEEILGGPGNLSVPLSNSIFGGVTHYGCSTALTEAMKLALEASDVESLYLYTQPIENQTVSFQAVLDSRGLSRVNIEE